MFKGGCESCVMPIEVMKKKDRHWESSLTWNIFLINSELTLELSLKRSLWQQKQKPIRDKASDATGGGRRSFGNTNGFLAVGSSKEIDETRPGRGNQIFKGLWHTGLLSQDRNNPEQNDEWDFPCTGHNTYVCSRKKSWSEKTWTSAAKEKPVCASHSGEIVRAVHLESPIIPTAWPRSVSFWGVPTRQPLKQQMWIAQGICLWETWHPRDLLAHLGWHPLSPYSLPCPWTGLPNGYLPRYPGTLKCRIQIHYSKGWFRENTF